MGREAPGVGGAAGRDRQFRLNINGPDRRDLTEARRYAVHLREFTQAYPEDSDIVALHAEAVRIPMRDDEWDPKTSAPTGQFGAPVASPAAAAGVRPELMVNLLSGDLLDF